MGGSPLWPGPLVSCSQLLWSTTLFLQRDLAPSLKLRTMILNWHGLRMTGIRQKDPVATTVGHSKVKPILLLMASLPSFEAECRKLWMGKPISTMTCMCNASVNSVNCWFQWRVNFLLVSLNQINQWVMCVPMGSQLPRQPMSHRQFSESNGK